MKVYEVNFDGLAGPTHNYAGLSYGNLASQLNTQQSSNPKAAALEGLEKMRMLMDLGIEQAVLPPHERPNTLLLKALGFTGSPDNMIQAAWKRQPETLIGASSAAAMWAANAATAAPSMDTKDGRLHITPANLSTKFHRAQEASFTFHLFKRIFTDEALFAIHPPLPNLEHLSDEGAANHTRLADQHASFGVHLFVFGKYAERDTLYKPKQYPARQTYEASKAVAEQNSLDPRRTFFAFQNPDSIDLGAFHSDVVSVGNENVFLYHEKAFFNSKKTLDELQSKIQTLIPIQVSNEELSLEEAIRTYLFNSQILTLNSGRMLLLCPVECRNSPSASQALKRIAEDKTNPIDSFQFADLRQSMRNGGGPACLRLRIVLTEQQKMAAHQGIFLTPKLHQNLKIWVKKHYRERLNPGDLADPLLWHESNQALDELSQMLQLGSIYQFQSK